MTAVLSILALCVALGTATVARADDPPKKGDGKVKFVVGQVTKTPDKNAKPPKPAPGKSPDAGKGKQVPPKGN